MRARAEAGFSLTELLVVIAIIGMLAAMVGGTVMLVRTRAKSYQNRLMMQHLKEAVIQMKAAYDYSGPIGLDENDEPLPPAQQDLIDIGWELDPLSDAWGAPKDKDELHFNKRLMRFYTVKKRQVAGGHLVDVFGNRIRYLLEERTMPRPDGTGNVRVVDEYLLSYGPDGQPDEVSGGNDDEKVKLGSYSLKE